MTRAPVTFEIPASADRGVCRSCGAEIAWVITKAGRKMPVELATKESHFAHCSFAAQHRKPRDGRR